MTAEDSNTYRKLFLGQCLVQQKVVILTGLYFEWRVNNSSHT